MTVYQWSGKRKWLWAIAAPSSQHSMGHFSVVFVKTKIFYLPFNFCMGHLHRITKLYVSNGPWPLPFPITGIQVRSTCGASVTRSLVFCVVFCRLFFVFLCFFFWPLCCLSSFYGFCLPIWCLQTYFYNQCFIWNFLVFLFFPYRDLSWNCWVH